MEDVILNFNYKGKEVKIQCKKNENINDIFKRYTDKINKDINNIYFINNGSIIKNNNLQLEKLNNKDNKINILVCDTNDSYNEEIIEKEFKKIICPKCGENCLFEIKNYKINLNKCDNKHNINNILLDEYNNTQIIDEIKCNKCNKNKLEIYNNKIYKCCNCNINLCPICKSTHNKEHKIIDYELNNYICKMHVERYTSYCKECERNICDICEIEHDINHNLIYHRDIINKKENNKNLDELKLKIDKLKNEIKEIVNKLNKIINNLDIYYNINKSIIKNNNIRNRNYQILININNINKYNNDIINDINNIINENNMNIKFKYLYEIYNKMIGNDNNTKIYKLGKYIGELNNDKREGKGIMYYNDGDKYEGEWKNNIKEGKGKYNYNDGEIYEGEWKNDKREGKGIYFFDNGHRYEGEFKNDKREGKGIMYYNNGDRYEGEYKNDQPEGIGVYYFNNGDIYEGDYKNGKKEGKGIYYYNNGQRKGDRYEGDFKNGKFEGKGIYYYNNGDREMGDYLNRKKFGKHVTLYANGNISSKDY